jgi:hypothetical protein
MGSPQHQRLRRAGIHQVWGIRKEQLVRRSIFNRIGLAAIAGCVALGSLAVAGCGGGSSTTGASGASGTSGSAPLSQSEFVSQANAACKQYQDAYGAVKQPPSNSSTSDVAAYAAQLLPLANRAHAQLAALTPPSDLQAKYTQYLSDNKSQIGLLQDAESAAKAGDVSKTNATLQKLEAGADQVNSEAQDLGLTVCGNA